MAKSLNRVTLLGNIVRDAETSFTPSGKAVTRFTIATEERYKDASGEWKEKAEFTSCSMWGKEKLAEYLTKGKKIYVEGRIQTRSYEKDGEKKYITEIKVLDVILTGSAKSESSGGGGYSDSSP